MRNKLLTFVLLLVFALAVTVASAQGPIAPEDVVIPEELPEGIELVYWHEWDGAQKEAIDAIIANFNENNEYGITITTVELGSTGPMRESISAGIVSGDLPNLSGGFLSDAQSYYLDGVLVPLDAYVDHPTWGLTEEERAQLDFEVINVNRAPGEPFNDQLLAWTIGYSGVVMSVNLDLMTELGFDGPPQDLETFREVACAAAEYTNATGGDVQGFPVRANAQDMHAFILSQGGDIWDAETETFDFDGEITLEVLSFFQQLAADGCAYLPETNFSNTADFAATLNPMAVGSSVGVPFILRDAAAAAEAGGTGVENWINTITPWSDDNQTLMLNFRSVVMYDQGPEANLASWLFLRHWASQESQQIWTELTRYQPYNLASLEALGEEFLSDNPQFSGVRDLIFNEEVRKYAGPQQIGWFTAFNEFSSVITQLMTDPNLDIAAAAAEAEELANEAYAEAQEALE